LSSTVPRTVWWLRPKPLGKLAALIRPRSWIKGWAPGMWRREGKDGVGEEWGRVEEEGRGKDVGEKGC